MRWSKRRCAENEHAEPYETQGGALRCSACHERLDAAPSDDVAARARRSDPDTSHEAASSVRESAKDQRSRIYRALCLHGPMTSDDLDALFGWRNATASRRLTELRDDLGLVLMLVETRKTRTGRRARLWRAVGCD